MGGEESIRLLKLDLQFFGKDGPGGEKTEEPTSKKLNDARKEGQVAKSRELYNAVSLMAAFIVFRIFGFGMGEQFVNIFRWVYGRIGSFQGIYANEIQIDSFTSLLNTIILKMLALLLPMLIIGFVIAFLCDALQIKWQVTGKPLQPKLSKLSPINGVKRLFSKEKLIELLKSLAKIAIISFVAWNTLKNKGGILFLLYDYEIYGAVSLVVDVVLDVGLRISAVYLILGIADLVYQKRKFHNDMMMTKQEVKDEYKNMEGDPQVKSKQKQRMMEASRRRMMNAVPQADVVITNPTHFAVALKYDASVADAPIVTAKGADLVARRIKEIARENNVEIVENKPLARMLYANVEIGAMVPPELYQAVAEVLAFVYNLHKDKEAV